MLRSHIVEADGIFLGAVVPLPVGFRFMAADLRVEMLDGSVWPTLADAQRVVGQLFRTGRLPDTKDRAAA